MGAFSDLDKRLDEETDKVREKIEDYEQNNR